MRDARSQGMRAAFTAVLLLLAAPAAASAKPLDADPTFARGGLFLRETPSASTSVIALAGGSTLHATDGDLMRLSPRGRMRRLMAGGAVELAPGLAVSGPQPLETRRLDASGRPGETRVVEAPGWANPLRVVRRRGGYAMLVWGRREQMLVALTRDGALDTAWGDHGIRRVAGDYDDLALGAAPDGSLVVTSTPDIRCFGKRKRRAILRVRRFGPGGARGTVRSLPIGPRSDCPAARTGDALVDGRGRVLISGYFSGGATIVRLDRELRRDRSFGARVRTADSWPTPARLERVPRGYALGFTGGEDGPRATVALFDRNGRRRALRRLKRAKGYPTSVLWDLALDRRGGLIAAGSLHDTDIFIREDYGQPHVAVWRVRRR